MAPPAAEVVGPVAEDYREQRGLELGAKILVRTMSHKNAWPFLKPVDVHALKLDDYFDIVKTPMDLGTVKKKLRTKMYKHPNEMKEDIELTFSNAILYNPTTDTQDCKSCIHRWYSLSNSKSNLTSIPYVFQKGKDQKSVDRTFVPIPLTYCRIAHVSSRSSVPFAVLRLSAVSVHRAQELKERFIRHWEKVDEFMLDNNEDECRKCGLGGTLLLCDFCTAAFHKGCIGLEEDPIDDQWKCPDCETGTTTIPPTPKRKASEDAEEPASDRNVRARSDSEPAVDAPSDATHVQTKPANPTMTPAATSAGRPAETSVPESQQNAVLSSNTT
eukprot:7989663-Pyramimonas_sp.AAC.1